MINITRISFRKKRYEQKERNFVANVSVTLDNSIILTNLQLVFNIYTQSLRLQWPTYFCKGKNIKHICFIDYEDVHTLEQKVIKEYFRKRKTDIWETSVLDSLIPDPE